MFDVENWKMEGADRYNMNNIHIINYAQRLCDNAMNRKSLLLIDGSAEENEKYADSHSVESIMRNMRHTSWDIDTCHMDDMKTLKWETNYDYVCFFNEKNYELGGNHADRIQKTNYYIAVENLIKSHILIENIMHVMGELNIGIAFSPMPIHGEYFMLDEMQIENNSYWCRGDLFGEIYKKNALLDSRESLEKIAKSMGYLTAVFMSDQYASVQWNNYDYMLIEVVKRIRAMSLAVEYKDLKSQIRHNCFDLIKFAQQNEQIAIYGTGHVAKIVTDFLVERALEINFYIVSDGYRKEETYEDKPVLEISEVMPNKKLGIVAALDKKHAKEISGGLKKKGFSNILYLENEFGV